MRDSIRKVMVVSVISALTLGNSAGLFAAQQQVNQAPASTDSAIATTIAALQEQLTKQQLQIEQLTTALAEQRAMIQQAHEPEPVRVASLAALPASVAAPARDAIAMPTFLPPAAAATAAQADLVAKVDDLGKKLDGAIGNLDGFKFSGDFRYRLDGQLRSGNAIAAPLQNVRSRYRVRLATDKELDSKFKFHFQLSTAPANNGITNDQDMAGIDTKHPFTISEVSVDFHPNSHFAIRGGRMEEVFADNMRFLFDDDVRFNGFQQIYTVPFKSSPGGFKSIEFRAGEYILSNPNVQILASSSAFTTAGYAAGGKVRDAALVHPGMIIKQDVGKSWSEQFGADIQLYRQHNQVQLASTAAGFPLLINGALGVTLSGALTGTGSATTTAGGAMFNAGRYEVVRSTYRLTRKGLKLNGRDMPLYFDVQGARNVVTHAQRDAVMGSVNYGAVKARGDFRLLYQFGLKEGNSIISQFTDDDLGTGSGVNIKVHAVRADFGLTKFLQFQNLFFFQREISVNDPANSFFVPLQKGANRTYRYLGQLAFTF